MKVVSGKVSIVMRILVFAFSPASALAGPEIFHTQDAETGDFPAGAVVDGSWSVIGSSAAAHNGVFGFDVDGPTAALGDTLTLPISSVGYHTIVVSLWGKVRAGLEGDDQVTIEWTNGTDRGLLQTISNQAAGDWVSYSFNLPVTADDDPDLAIIFRAILSSTGDRMGLDDVIVAGIPIPEPTPLSLLSLGSLAMALVRRRFS